MPVGLGDGTVVTLLVDSAPVATLDRAPYRALWAPAPGSHIAVAVATDPAGRRVESAAVPFTVLQRVPDDRNVYPAPTVNAAP